MILLIDNYDSFTYNLVQYLGELKARVVVHRNDAITVDEVFAHNPQGVVISPGPGRPENAGISLELIRRCEGRFPLLGVCLGHQAIGAAFGGSIVPAPTIMHGKTSEIFHDGETIFKNLPQPFVATRYHSLVIDPQTLPEELEISARTSDDVIMGVRHKTLPLEGVQFHPESILTTVGKNLLFNFLNLCESFQTRRKLS